jgi:hypothetical protein
VETEDCILQGDVRTKVKTPGAGKNESRRDCASSYLERLCKLHYFPVPSSCLVCNTEYLPHALLLDSLTCDGGLDKADLDMIY